MYKRLTNFVVILFSLFFAGGVLVMFTAGDNPNNQVLGVKAESNLQSRVKGNAINSDEFYGFWECGADVYSCEDFNFAEAQAVFEFCGGVNNDVHNLDRDNTGIACSLYK